jgi:hypothetical protein
MSRQIGELESPAERANFLFADPLNLIQVILAEGSVE